MLNYAQPAATLGGFPRLRRAKRTGTMAGETVNITNRKARFQYEILETFEAGLQLKGSEVKSVRAGQVSLAEAYCKFEENELYLVSCRIAPYSSAGTHEELSPIRPRKLLLRRTELRRLLGRVTTRGLTIVPLRVYNKGRLMKLEIGLARGKKAADKRQAIKERDLQREAQAHKGKFHV